MWFFWKQHDGFVSDACQFINTTAFLWLYTKTFYVVTLKPYETKVRWFDEVFSLDAFYRWLDKLQVILPAYVTEWIIE